MGTGAWGRRSLSGRVFWKAGCVCLLGFILAGCDNGERTGKAGSEDGAQAPRAGGVYRTPLLNNPKGLDPARAEDQYSAAVVYQLFDGLVRFSPDLLIIPAIAENWQIEHNGLLYHFFLRKNARFHNGRPITSRDVVFSLSRLIRANPAPSILPHVLKIVGASEYRNGEADGVAGLQAVNEWELLIQLEEPYAPFLAALGMHQTRIVPETEVLRAGDDFARNPVGSGAFRFVAWDDNKSIFMKNFSDYYLGSAFLDAIQYVIYPGGRVEDVLTDFKSHKLEDMPVYGNTRKELLSQEGVKWVHRPSLSLLFYGMNCRHPLLQHPSVRRALSMVIDRRKLVSNIYEEQFEPARSILPPGILGYNPRNPAIEDNMSKAREELEQALGRELENGPTLEVVSGSQSPVARAELEFIAKCWEQLGITLKPKFIPDWAEFEAYVKSSSMQIYRYVWFMDIPDPDNVLQVLFGSDSNMNFMQYRSTQIDRMLHEARIIFQPAERADIYRNIEGLIVQDAPVIPLVYLSIDQVYQSNVQGIQLNALGAHKASLYRVWLSPEE